MILNFSLQIKTGLNILGGSESAIIWLSFWGSFLAAISAGFLGWVSLQINQKAIKQNKISIEQNNKTLHNCAWNKMVSQYNKLEVFVITQEKLHSLETIQKIKAIVIKKEGGDNQDNKIQLLQIKTELRGASIRIGRFVNESHTSDCCRETDNSLSIYGNALRAANTGMIEYLDALYNSLTPGHTGEEQFDEKKYKELISSCSRIMVSGFDYLKEKKNEIMKFAKEHDIEQGSFI